MVRGVPIGGGAPTQIAIPTGVPVGSGLGWGEVVITVRNPSVPDKVPVVGALGR